MKALLSSLAVMFLCSVSLAELPDYTDGEYLALAYSGELVPPPALAAEIDGDLAAIKSAWSELADIHPMEEFTPGYLSVKLTDEAYAAWQAGTFTELDDLNQQYSANHIDPLFNLKLLRIHYTPLNHPLVMAPVYEALEGVRYATAGGVIGDGDDIQVNGPHRYTLSAGWGDCLSGCLNHEYWVFEVLGGVPWLRDHYYRGPASEAGPTLPNLVLDAAPNPFNPATTFRFETVSAGPVRLVIHDLGGRPVVTLVDRALGAGPHAAPWQGTDDAGRKVASGVYVARLETREGLLVRSVTLLK